MTGIISVIHISDWNAETHRFWTADESFVQQSTVLSSSIENIVLPESSKRIVIFVPSQDIFLTTVTLPPTPLALRGQTALYALEDQLAEDVQDLHAVAIPDVASTKLFNVAIIKKILMENFLKRLQVFSGRQVIVVPDIFLVPTHQEQWQMVMDENRALVRRGLLQGFATSEKNLPSVLKLFQVNATQLVATSFEKAIQRLTPPPALNLLQGDYRLSKPLQALKTLWRRPLLILGVWIIILLISFAIKYSYLTQQETILSQQISDLYKQAYPNATSVVSPRARIEGELSQLGQTNASSEFLSILSTAAQVKVNNPDVQIQSLGFRNEQLTLDVTAKEFKMLDQFSRQLQDKGLTVQQNSAAREKQKVLVNLVISKGTS